MRDAKPRVANPCPTKKFTNDNQREPNDNKRDKYYVQQQYCVRRQAV
jgi:hypothetical protein